MGNKWEENQFTNDTVRQLKAGMTCYAYKEEQVKEIKQVYKEKTGLNLKVKKEDYYYVITPLKQVTAKTY